MMGGLRVLLQQALPIRLDVELECATGEVLALVGPSGSGKSTVLRCIAGLHRPAVGQVICAQEHWLDTQQGINRSPQQRKVGIVFQSYALFPHLTALDNVALACQAATGGDCIHKARELLAKVHLDGLEMRRPAALSGGQQQRVALARALARDPVVLLLDEPFSAVDQVTRRKLRLELAALIRSLQIPVILVTHDLDEAFMLADRLCVIHGGTSLQTGTPAAVTQQPRDAVVARLLDRLNLFEGEVEEHERSRGITRLRWRAGSLELSLDERFPVGAKVHWMIPPGSVLLHQRRRPSNGERENPVQGQIVELLATSSLATVIMRLNAAPSVLLTLELPPHVVARNELRIGEAVAASIIAARVHMMPWRSLLKSGPPRMVGEI